MFFPFCQGLLGKRRTFGNHLFRMTRIFDFMQSML
jgi:hypothetical protein